MFGANKVEISVSIWDKLGRIYDAVAPHVHDYVENLERSAEREERVRRHREETAAYQHGEEGNETAIVLSAAGRHEAAAKRPASGQTGTTLNKVLANARAKDPETFRDADKTSYRIVNAVETVHHKRATGRTEARSDELLDPANIKRLKADLADKKKIVALGDKAIEAVVAAGRTPTLTGPHPSRFRELSGHKGKEPQPFRASLS